MPDTSRKSVFGLDYLNLGAHPNTYWNLTTPELYEHALVNGEAKLTKDFALSVYTGAFTGRSPKDKFIVDEPSVHNDIDWGSVNQPISSEVFDRLFQKMVNHLHDKPLYIHDAVCGADPAHALPIRVVSEAAYHALFAKNMFRELRSEQYASHKPGFTVLAAPSFQAIPAEDGTKTSTFILCSFERKLILIGGTLYSGEVKKGIFSVMNYLLPKQGVMPMHCSANVDDKGNSAVFFGLSGTGKTTLSADQSKTLIGDDEHGWSDNGIFNFEGGCYAKTINLSAEGEPLIYATTKMHGTILENVPLNANREPNFNDDSLTENTRCSYPLSFIPNADEHGIAGHPKNIIFLTADAFGVLPPLSKLTKAQAMYHFMSGYTAKVAGTERGVTEPQATFSACFGAPFMPMHPAVYAELLAKKIEQHGATVWLVNTGWTGGPYGIGSRMKLGYTRRMLDAALSGELNQVAFETEPFFGLAIPSMVSGVPKEILHPRSTWKDTAAYDQKAKELAAMFRKNFTKYAAQSSAEIVSAEPKA